MTVLQGPRLSGGRANEPARSGIPGQPAVPVPGELVAFQARPVRSWAMYYDGTLDSQNRLRQWVQRLHPRGTGVTIAADVVTVSEPWCDDQVELTPGHYLVFAQGGSCCWTVASPGQVETWLERRPRELPIFNDGEVPP